AHDSAPKSTSRIEEPRIIATLVLLAQPLRCDPPQDLGAAGNDAGGCAKLSRETWQSGLQWATQPPHSPHIRASKLPMYRSFARLPLATLLLASLAPPSDAQSVSRRAAAAPQTLGQVLADDATPRDIAFVDAKPGWVVGDRGMVLATEDGGRHWHRQE